MSTGSRPRALETRRRSDGAATRALAVSVCGAMNETTYPATPHASTGSEFLVAEAVRELRHSPVRAPGERDVVQRHGALDLGVGLQAGQAHDVEVAGERSLQSALEVGALGCGEEADGPEVDAEDGHVG